jgi:hypothetical protein
MLESAGLPTPLRVQRQHCGLLYGADSFGWNYYADLIVGKMSLDVEMKSDSVRQSYLFPGPHEDDLYDVLQKCRPKVPYLVDYSSN